MPVEFVNFDGRHLTFRVPVPAAYVDALWGARAWRASHDGLAAHDVGRGRRRHAHCGFTGSHRRHGRRRQRLGTSRSAGGIHGPRRPVPERIEMDGRNYVVPVDTRLERDVDVRYETVTLDDLLVSRERDVGVCGGGRDGGGRAGRNSPYTAALLSHLETPLEIGLLFSTGCGRRCRRRRTARSVRTRLPTHQDRCRRSSSTWPQSAVAQDVRGGPEAEGPARIRHRRRLGPRPVPPLPERGKSSGSPSEPF